MELQPYNVWIATNESFAAVVLLNGWNALKQVLLRNFAVEPIVMIRIEGAKQIEKDFFM